jgi:hypothetical protein
MPIVRHVFVSRTGVARRQVNTAAKIVTAKTASMSKIGTSVPASNLPLAKGDETQLRRSALVASDHHLVPGGTGAPPELDFHPTGCQQEICSGFARH